MKYKVIKAGVTCKLLRYSSGHYALYLDRRTTTTLKTKDKELALEKFKAADQRRRQSGIVMEAKVRDMRLAAFKDEYLAARLALVNVDELAPATYKADRVALDNLLRCVGDIHLNKVEAKVETFKQRMLAGASCLEKRKNTINTYLRHLCSAFSWAACENRSTGRPAYLVKNPFAETRTVKVKYRGIERLPKYISRDDITAMRRSLQHELIRERSLVIRTNQFPEQWVLTLKAEDRIKVLIDFGMFFELLLHTGLRISELVSLDWKDVDMKQGLIHIRKAKARKERMVAMPEALVDILQAYGPLDLGEVCRYTADHVRKTFKEVAYRAGLDNSATPHSLRHSYGTYAAHMGIPLDVIQRNMGHASLRTTEIYKDVLVSRQQREVKGLVF